MKSDECKCSEGENERGEGEIKTLGKLQTIKREWDSQILEPFVSILVTMQHDMRHSFQIKLKNCLVR